MASTSLTVRNPSGLHARPLALFVRTAGPFGASIRVRNLDRDPERQADAKSILALMTLGVSNGHRIEVTAEGPDAEAAVAALRAAVEAGLGETLSEAPSESRHEPRSETPAASRDEPPSGGSS